MHMGLVPPAPANGNHSFGFLLQTMLYLTNYTQDRSANNSLQDYYHLPAGAGMGKLYDVVEVVFEESVTHYRLIAIERIGRDGGLFDI